MKYTFPIRRDILLPLLKRNACCPVRELCRLPVIYYKHLPWGEITFARRKNLPLIIKRNVLIPLSKNIFCNKERYTQDHQKKSAIMRNTSCKNILFICICFQFTILRNASFGIWRNMSLVIRRNLTLPVGETLN